MVITRDRSRNLGHNRIFMVRLRIYGQLIKTRKNDRAVGKTKEILFTYIMPIDFIADKHPLK